MSGNYTNSNGANIVFFYDYKLMKCFFLSVFQRKCGPCGSVQKFNRIWTITG